MDDLRGETLHACSCPTPGHRSQPAAGHQQGRAGGTMLEPSLERPCETISVPFDANDRDRTSEHPALLLVVILLRPPQLGDVAGAAALAGQIKFVRGDRKRTQARGAVVEELRCAGRNIRPARV